MIRHLATACCLMFGLASAAAQAPLVLPMAAPASAQLLQPRSVGEAKPANLPAPLIAPSAPSSNASNGTAVDTRPLLLDSRDIALGGAFRATPVWQTWKGRFVTDHGRVVDTGNSMISHSEGQGYGMLLAVAAGDRVVFDRIWSWTRANLMVRDDELFAWRWEPNQRPAVSDMNNASDGDLLIAWALTEAAEYWGDVSYRVMARRIAVEVGRKVVLYKTKRGSLLLPAIAGFSAQDRTDGPVVNLSYWVFPAFERLPIVAPEIDWSGISQSGLDLLKASRFGSTALPTDWISASDAGSRPADGFAARFGYNAIRIPLYLAWAGLGERDHYTPFINWSRARRGALPVVEVASGRNAETYGEAGYSSIAALLSCVTDQAALPGDLRNLHPGENYYPSTLHMLVLLAAQMRYPSCFRG